ncbi:MAG: hypothetical protein Q9190_006486 [Brigantiaea leucoxantha]
MSSPVPPSASCVKAAFSKAQITKCTTASSISSRPQDLPRTSLSRLHSSLGDLPYDLSRLPTESKTTVLYLAYGSNLCAETFLNRRKIRPLSAINVAVPELTMTFDLPGFPYSEPCFANTDYSQASSLSKYSYKKRLENPVSHSEETPLLPSNKVPYRPIWPYPLIGVVYEVTLSDYAHIIATEGGGASYTDITADCYPLDKDLEQSPHQPAGPSFKAHTLLSPHSDKSDPPKFSRPDPNYAQPSARYLKLITDGATEHSLPKDYQEYLASLQPYTITTQGQKLGQLVFMMTWYPIVAGAFSLTRLFSDKDGKTPGWLAKVLGWVFWGVWVSYDNFFKPLFGDGERTIGEEERHETKRQRRRLRKRKLEREKPSFAES